jgi:hypothetical protein
MGSSEQFYSYVLHGSKIPGFLGPFWALFSKKSVFGLFFLKRAFGPFFLKRALHFLIHMRRIHDIRRNKFGMEQL